MDNDLLLVLKVNDYLRNIDNHLGNPVNSFVHTAFYCCNSVQNFRVKHHLVSFWEKMGLNWERFKLIFALKLYRLLIRWNLVNDETAKMPKGVHRV